LSGLEFPISKLVSLYASHFPNKNGNKLVAETFVTCADMKLFMSLLQSKDDLTCDVSVGSLLAILCYHYRQILQWKWIITQSVLPIRSLLRGREPKVDPLKNLDSATQCENRITTR
jgi:hypothetical protein